MVSDTEPDCMISDQSPTDHEKAALSVLIDSQISCDGDIVYAINGMDWIELLDSL